MDAQSIVLASSSDGPVFNVGLFCIMIVLIGLSAFFSMSETAFSSSSQVKIRMAVEDRRIHLVKVQLRDATEEEIEQHNQEKE
ncbi:TPA: DUF21 domain-containing protein [Candidatus Avacholeplasma faecigallinarum]|nr:DUF21 domain-containing protein [Candidatus Avacholeplasma faecigallinarum]